MIDEILIEKYSSDAFQIESNTIVMRVFLFIMNPKVFNCIDNQKENCHYVRIPESFPFYYEPKGVQLYW